VTVNDAQVSPDGTMFAYVASAVDLKENAVNADIWLAAVDGGRSVRLTTSPKADNQPRWSPDGRTLAFVSAREEKPQLFLISPTGGEAERVTTSKTGVQGFQWSPDGKQIAFLAEQEPTAEEERRLKDKDDVQLVDRDFKYRHLWLLDVASREAREIVGGNVHAGDPQWSPDGRSIAYVTAPTPKADDGTVTDVWIVEVGTGAKRKLLDNPGPDSAPRW